MQSAKIVRVFVASPGDVLEERTQACEVIRLWNAANSFHKSIIIEPVLVESHGQSMQGGHPQDLINAQLLERCDLLIAILWHRLGTPTDTDMSGTVQEIREFSKIKGHKQVMIFFCSKDLPQGFDRNQYDALMKFKSEVQSSGIYFTYKSPTEFATLFRHQIDMAMNVLSISDMNTKSRRSNDRILMPESNTLLAAGALAGTSGIVVSSNLNGTEIFANEVAYSDPDNGRSEANWIAGIEELSSLNLIRDEGSKREIFSLTKTGFAYADDLWMLLLSRYVEKAQTHEHSYVDVRHDTLFETIGQKLTRIILQEKAIELQKKGLMSCVSADGGILAMRLEAKGRKFLREYASISFATPDR